MGFPFLFLILLSPFVATAPSDCLAGIETAIGKFDFNATESYFQLICQNDLSLYSMWAAAKVYCTPYEIAAGTVLIGGYCAEDGFELVPYDTYLPNLTDAAIASLPPVDFSDIDASKEWNNSLLISKDLFESAVRTAVFDQSYVNDKIYGWGAYGFWGGVLAIGIISRLLNVVRGCMRPVNRNIESSLHGFPSKLNHWFYANFVVPPVFGSHHRRRLYTFTVPTRIQTLVILAFYIYSIIACSISYEVFWPNLYYTPSNQAWRYIADRTGILSYANLPIMWIFAGRNNIFLWATGWEFSTFNLFHRHLARIATVQAIAHSAAYTILEISTGDYWADWKDQYWYMGGMATCTMAFIVIFSSWFLRRWSYELFLALHIILSLMTLIALFFHTGILGYNYYLWPVAATWSFDRFLRLLRQAYLNISLRRSSFHVTHARTEFVKDANLLILTISLPGNKLSLRTLNQHVFIYQPFRWRGWENHPFTAVISSPNTMTLYIRPLGNFTARLTASLEPRLIVEGTYSTPQPIWGEFDSILLIAGGSGVSATLSYLHYFLRGTRGLETRGSMRIKFVWAVREEAFVREIVRRELSRLCGEAVPGVAVDIFVTSPEPQVSVQFDQKDIEKPEAMPSSMTLDKECAAEDTTHQTQVEREFMRFHYGHRPDIRDIIAEECEEGTRTAVVVCGPTGMADEGREAVRLTLMKGAKIELVDVGFGW